MNSTSEASAGQMLVDGCNIDQEDIYNDVTDNLNLDMGLLEEPDDKTDMVEQVVDAGLASGLSSMLDGYGSGSDGPNDEHGRNEMPELADDLHAHVHELASKIKPDGVQQQPELTGVSVPSQENQTSSCLKPGSLIEIIGLNKAVTLNGRQGVARRPDPSRPERWEIEFKLDGEKNEVKSIRRANMRVIEETGNSVVQELSTCQATADKVTETPCSHASEKPHEIIAGSAVQVHGLKKAATLNGRCGIVSQLDPSQPDRWQVVFETTDGRREIKSIRHSNLEVIDDAFKTDGGDADDGKPLEPSPLSNDSCFTEEASYRKASPPEAAAPTEEGLTPGSFVRIVGLKKVTELNGCVGVVRRADPKLAARWEVEVKMADGNTQLKSIRACNIEKEFPPCGIENNPINENKLATSSEDHQVSGSSETMLEQNCAVRVEGLKVAAALNGRLGIARRPDHKRQGRWEVEFELGGGASETKSICERNLVLVHENSGDVFREGERNVEEQPTKEDVDLLQVEIQPDNAQRDCQDDSSNEGEGEADEDNVSQEEGQESSDDGFKVGMHVQILHGSSSISKAAFGTLRLYDPSSGLWQVNLSDGRKVALPQDNLSVQAQQGNLSEPGNCEDPQCTVDETQTSSACTPNVVGKASLRDDVLREMDANEIAAALLQAELGSDHVMIAKLETLLAERRASDGSVPVNGDANHADGGDNAGGTTEERVEVPMEAVGFVIGQGGQTIQKLSANSGARFSFLKEEGNSRLKTRICVVCGSADMVSCGVQLLQEAIAQALSFGKGLGKSNGKGGKTGKNTTKGYDFRSRAGGSAGLDAGICKWYAAGFCRNSAPSGCCRNGLHEATAAKHAESTWISEGPATGSVKRCYPHLPVLLVLDLEGGGNKDGRDGEDEIIEVPVLAMCPVTGQELGRFHRFSRPGYWDRERCSMRARFAPSCFNDDSASIPFPEVIAALESWIRLIVEIPETAQLDVNSFLFVTCGDWDVKTAIPRQCNKPMPGMVKFDTQALLFSRWSNLKEVFRDHYQIAADKAPTGMRGMLNRLRIPLIGQHHLGMDDVSNLAKILKALIADGCNVGVTGHAKSHVSAGHRGERPRAAFHDPAFSKAYAVRKGAGKPVNNRTKFKGKGASRGKDKGWPDMHKGLIHATANVGLSVVHPESRGVKRPADELTGDPSAAEAEYKSTRHHLGQFLQGAPAPGEAWAQCAALESSDSEVGDPASHATAATTADRTSMPQPRPGESWAQDDELEACAMEISAPEDTLLADANFNSATFLEGVLSRGSPNKPNGVSTSSRISTLLAGLPAPRAASNM